MKRVFYTLFLMSMILVTSNAFSQPGAMDPNDPDRIFSTNDQTPAPPYNQISKWGHKVRLNWNPFSYGYKSYYFKGMSFRLKFPKTYQPGVNDGKKYPCFIFLHGLGEWAEIHDNELQLVHGGQTHAQHVDNGDFDGYLIYPQSSSGWLGAYRTTILDLMDSLTLHYKMDENRVIISGLSSGGQTTWDYLLANPERFANVADISARNPTPGLDWVKDVLSIPAWVANGGKDTGPYPESITDIVNKYNELGGDIKQSFYPNSGHGVWDYFWAEPGYFQFLADANKTQPVVKFHHNEFCPNVPIKAVLILQPGFYQYEWQKDNITMPSETLDSLVATEFGTYRARFKRTSTSEWSDWSPRPVVVSAKQATVTPPIAIDGLHSSVLPAPDGSTTVPLKVPEGYASYDWRRVSDNAQVSTTNTYLASVGQYKVQVTEAFGCSSSYSDPFNAIDANGVNVPDKASSVNAVTLNNSSIEVYWNNNPAPAYNETSFEIYRSTQSGSGYVLAGIVSSDVLQFTDQNLLPNVKYFYIVRAVNANGASPISNEASAITFSDNTPPTSPVGLSITSSTRHSISLLWGESTDDVGIKFYEIYINGEKAYTTPESSFKVNNLDSFQNYSFYVKAVDISGNQSVPSNQVVGFTKNKGLDYSVYQGTWSVLPDFSSLTPIAIGHSDNVDISVSPVVENYGMVWQGWVYIPVSATYRFYIDSDDGSAFYLNNWYAPGLTPTINNDGLHGTISEYKDISMTKGMHKIAITFFQAGGGQSMTLSWRCSAAGFGSKTKIPDLYLQDNNSPTGVVPAMPSNLRATVQSYNKVDISWSDNSSNETGFEVYRKGPEDPDYKIVGLVSANSTSYLDSLAQGNSTYAYAVQAINNNGGSGFNPDDLSGVSYNFYEGSWDNLPNFNSLTPVSSGVIDNFSLSPALVADNFAFKYSATLNVPAAGSYTFYTKSDDGSKLYIDNFNSSGQVVNNDFLQGPTERSGTKTLTAGPHKIFVTFFEKGGGEFLEVRWQGPGIAKELIPNVAMVNSRTVVTTPAPPAIPDIPGNVQVAVLSTHNLGVSFDDNSTQTGYEIYRSLDNQVSWRLLNILQTTASSISMIDSSLYPNMTAFYKVRAFNTTGYSDYSPAVSGKTENTNPIITQMGSRSVYYAGTTLMPVSAVDNDGDNMQFTVTDMPGIMQFVPTSNGNGNLVFNTDPSDAGIYNMKVVVNDGNGGKDSTEFTLSITSNRPPTLGRIQSVSMDEGTVVVKPVSAIDPDRFTVIKYQINNAPSFVEGRETPGGGFSVFLTPGYADAGNYEFWIVVRDGAGGFDSSMMSVTVKGIEPPTQKVYINMLNNGSTPVPPAPWNNLTGSSAANFLDNSGNITNTSISFNPAVWNTSTAGGGTGNNSGVYIDDVIRDNFYFGFVGIPDTIRFSLTGLDINSRYNLNLFSASTYSTGSTIFNINGQIKSINAYNNTQNTADFKQVLSDGTGAITVKMYKAPGVTVGYLNAIVLEKPYDDGTTPVKPTDFTAVPLLNGKVLLQWKDVAYNEYGYLILRSTSENGAFTKLNEGQNNVNALTFLDSTCYGNSPYFYKILAYNNYGNSDTVGIASVITTNRPPVVNDLASIFLNAQNSIDVNVNATDDPGEPLTIEAFGLPSFATLENTGNGTAVIHVNPNEGDEGFYNNINIKVSDNYGAYVIKTLSITVAEPGLRTVYLNFGPGSASPEPAPWNNYLGYPSGGYTINNLKDALNTNSGFSFKFVNTLGGNNTTGMTASNTGIYSDNVLKNAVQIDDNSTYHMQFGGLNPANKYNVVMMSSYNYGLEDSATFSSGGLSVGIRGNYNTNKTVQLNGLVPNGSGVIDIAINRNSTTRYFLLNAVALQEYSGSPLIKPSNLFAEPTVSTNKIRLMWSDRSNSETGYEIWRSNELNGSYSLVTTLASNTTTYYDQSSSLVPGKTYYYKVRAKRTSEYSTYSNVAKLSLAANLVLLNFNAEVANHEALPWNNTDNGPSDVGTKVTDMVNSNYLNTGIDFEITRTFNGKGFAGMPSGILPYNVMYTNYWTDAGQVSEIKFSHLDLRKEYRIGIFNSVNLESGFHNGIYTVHGKSRAIDGTANTNKMIYLDNVLPDENGEIYLTVTPSDISAYTFTNAVTVEGFDPSGDGQSGGNLVARQKVGISGAVTTMGEISENPLTKDNNPNKLTLTAYPNPFVSTLILDYDLPVASANVTVEIFDIQSRLILRKELGRQGIGRRSLKLNVQQDMSPGTYLIKLKSDDKSQIIKLVKGK